MVFTIEKLYEVCYNSDIQTVREIVISKEVDLTIEGAKVKSFLPTHLFKDSLLEHWSVSCESS